MSKLFVDQVDPKTATTLTLGTSGDTISIPSGVTIANAGTATGFGETNTPSLKAVRGSAQSIPNTTSTVVIFDTEIYDTDSAYDNSTGIFTVPAGKGGKYAFFVTGGYDDNGDINIANFWLSKNNQTAISATGGLAIGIDYFHKGTSAQNIAQQVSGCFDLAAGDTMRVYTWQNYGSARDLNQGGRMTFSGFRISS
jgi:hypothetical protein